jgi:hypothetical protein
MKGVEIDDEDKDSEPVCTVQSSSLSSSSVEETMLQLDTLVTSNHTHSIQSQSTATTDLSSRV